MALDDVVAQQARISLAMSGAIRSASWLNSQHGMDDPANLCPMPLPLG